MGNFALAYPKTKQKEGGWANVAGDSGLETYCGISRRWYPKWKGWAIVDKHKPLKHNQVINDAKLNKLVYDFYKAEFWDVINGDKIDDQPTVERLYDFGVTSGQSRSILQIQEVLGIPQTGKADKITIEAINNPCKYLIQ